ncbi:MAG TPA: S8 family serine peptidase [Armatimonadota bacterium]
MIRYCLRIGIILTLVLLSTSLFARSLPRVPARAYVPGQFVVGFDHSATGVTVQSVQTLGGALTIKHLPQVGAQLMRTSAATDIPALCAQLRKLPGVRYCEPNYTRRVLLAAPNDPAYSNLDKTVAPFDPDFDPASAIPFQWGLHIIQAAEAWGVWPNTYYTSATKPANAVKLAVIDTGLDIGGPDGVPQPDFINAGGTSQSALLGGQVDLAEGINVLAAYADPSAFQDDYGHGTAVASVAAAATNNGGTPQSANVTPSAPTPDGVAGLGYNAQIMPIKAMDATGNGTEADIVAGIMWAVDHGAVVINISAGDYSYSQAEQDAVDYAWEHGTLICAAAGNDGSPTLRLYPAACAGVMAVAATAIYFDPVFGLIDMPASYSNSGNYVVVSAPGGDVSYVPLGFWGIWCAEPTDSVPVQIGGWPPFEGTGTPPQYQYQVGTSVACPFVAGLAALYAGSQGITQATPGGVMQMWRAILRGCDNTAQTGGWNSQYGWGRINAYQTMLGADNRGALVGAITGQVYYRGTVAGNASVRAVPSGGGSQITATTNVNDGTYRLGGLTAGTYNVTASIFGENQTINTVTVEAGVDTPRVTFQVGSTALPVTVTGAAWVDATHVDVTFNQKVDTTTAQTVGNYSLAPTTTVSAAVLNGAGTVVRLTLAAQAANTSYTLTVTGVQDLVGNPIAGPGNTATWITPGPPILSWTGASGYTSDGVQPDRGPSGASFTFKVRLQQPDGTAPNSVLLHLTGPLGEVAGSPFLMTGAGATWTTGVVFSKSVALAESGAYSYYFEAVNGVGTTALPAAGSKSGPLVSQPPDLSLTGEVGYTASGVAPTRGTPGASFVFRVLYSDVEGDPASYVKVRIWGPSGEVAGSPFLMDNATGGTDWTGGVIFTKSVALIARGSYRYRFVASDGIGTGTLPSPTRTWSGPIVDTAPVLTWAGTPGFLSAGVSPTVGSVGNSYKFQIKYSDANGDPAQYVRVRIWLASTGAEIANSPFTLRKFAGTDFIGGVVYGTTVTLNTAATYRYKFYASDGLLTTNYPANPKSGPTVSP